MLSGYGQSSNPKQNQSQVDGDYWMDRIRGNDEQIELRDRQHGAEGETSCDVDETVGKRNRYVQFQIELTAT